jgi:hypothetical protein
MVFGKPEHFHAKLITQLGFRDAFRDHAMIPGRFAAFGEEEIAEAQHGGLHGVNNPKVRTSPAMRKFFPCPHPPAGL